jgi:Rod binding domain-containing protein
MKIQANTLPAGLLQAGGPSAKTAAARLLTAKTPAAGADNPQLHKAFDDFVGEAFYGQMLKAMRNTVGPPAYFNGGRAEEVFTQQLDQVLAQKLSQAGAEQFSGPMYQLFTMGRR